MSVIDLSAINALEIYEIKGAGLCFDVAAEYSVTDTDPVTGAATKWTLAADALDSRIEAWGETREEAKRKFETVLELWTSGGCK